MLSAQEDPQGIPQEFIDKKMEELEKLKVLNNRVVLTHSKLKLKLKIESRMLLVNSQLFRTLLFQM